MKESRFFWWMWPVASAVFTVARYPAWGWYYAGVAGVAFLAMVAVATVRERPQ